MQRMLALSLAGVVVASAIGFAQDEDPVRKAMPDEYKKLATMTQYFGPIGGVSAKSVTFRFDDGEYKRLLQQAEAIPNAAQKLTAVKQVEAKFAALKLMFGKEFELEFTTKMPTLRQTKVPGLEFDDKGFPKVVAVPKFKSGNSWLYAAKPEDFTPGAKTLLIFGAQRNGRPTVSAATVENSK